MRLPEHFVATEVLFVRDTPGSGGRVRERRGRREDPPEPSEGLVSVLSRAIDEGTESVRGSVSDLYCRVDTLDSKVNAVVRMLEDVMYDVRDMTQRMDALARTTHEALSRLEERSRPAPRPADDDYSAFASDDSDTWSPRAKGLIARSMIRRGYRLEEEHNPPRRRSKRPRFPNFVHEHVDMNNA